MKLYPTLMTAILSFVLAAPELSARSFARSSGGGRAKAAPQRSMPKAPAKRSPMTSSKLSRPAARPQPKPAYRPQPAARPNVSKPTTRPSVSKPTTRPSVSKPTTQPSVSRPTTRPSVSKPTTRPSVSKPATRPDTRPTIDRPGTSKPATLPGMVTYPNRPSTGKPSRPGAGAGVGIGAGVGAGIGAGDRPSTLPATRPSIVDRNPGNRNPGNAGDRRPGNGFDRPNVGGKNVGLNRPSTLPANKRDWNSNKWGGNNSVWGNKVNIGNNVNVNINNNFRNNNNFAYRPNYWGARPWWGASNYHRWHHGHWGYGWNSAYYHRHWYYRDDSFARGFMWGIGVWSLGNMIYNMGYQTYSNPYPAPAVQNTYITYSEPVSVAAAANPPGDEETSATAEAKSAEAMETSRNAFKNGDYTTALKSADEALSHTPGDVTLHEYRSLVFFALGKYSDAAGVLNPVLASGPGWSWDTMIGFYNGSEAYNEQLKRLEGYVSKTDKADGHFLLGYHYMVCGHMEESNTQFTKASELEPGDSISRQLAALTADSIPNPDADDSPPPPAPDPVPNEKLVGTWTNSNQTGKVTFEMKASGDYSWAYQPTEGESTELKGTYGLDDQGLLVLTSDDTQMVSEIIMPEDDKMHFTLIGAPDGDPGLDFTKN